MKYLLMLLICAFSLGSYTAIEAQSLNKKITFKVTEKTLDEILSQLDQNFGFSFSYMNNELPEEKITLEVKDKPLNEVLDVLLQNSLLIYVEHDGQIIIKRGIQKPTSMQESQSKNLPKKNTPLLLASTDTIPVPINEDEGEDNNVDEAIIDQPYEKDTIDEDSEEIEIIEPASRTSEDKNDDDEWKQVQADDEVFDEYDQVKSYHFGVFYPISTNGIEAGRYVNNFSMHLFAGYSKGLRGFEYSNLGNLVKEDVYGVQVSGLGNIAGGRMAGGQFAGIANIVGEDANGIQVAGTANLVNGRYVGVQAAGVLNVVNGNVDGFQVAGALNIAEGDVNSGQVAGFMNIAKSVDGPQIAGFANIQEGAGNGTQVAGFMNIADSLDGPQIAGFLNVAEQVDGLQASGFLNIAKSGKGVQLGIINISDSLDGVPIGLFSVVKKNGYYDLELFYAEDFQTNAIVKLGVPKFHNLFGVSYELDNKNRYAFGYGIGSQWGKKLLRLNTDLIVYHVFESSFPDNIFRDNKLNLLANFRFLGSLHFGNFGIFFGPVLNAMASQHVNVETGEIGSDWGKDYIVNETYDDKTNLKMWIGFNAGIRF